MTEEFRIVAQIAPPATTPTDAFTATVPTRIIGVTIANRSSVATAFRMSVAVNGEADDVKQYLFYDVPILGNETIDLSVSVTALQVGDIIRVYATLATLSFNFSGIETT